MQDEEWVEIDGFPDYVINREGRVVNTRTRRELKINKNQQGIGSIGVYRNRVLSRLVVGNLVAGYSLPRKGYERNKYFTSVIYLNGDKADPHVENLAWRPRWFAVKYHKQFYYPDFHSVRLPLRDIETGEEFDTVTEVCIKYGLYYGDVISSCANGPATFPTFQRFEWIR